MTYKYRIDLLCLYDERKWERHEILVSFPYFMSQDELTDAFERIVEDMPREKYLDFEALCERIGIDTDGTVIAKERLPEAEGATSYEIQLHWS